MRGRSFHLFKEKGTSQRQRNADGQLTAIRQGMATLAAYTYDSAGRRASRTLSNGLITGNTYNVRGELTSAAIGDGTNPPLWRNDYGYNPVGNRTWTRYGDSSSLGDAYTYDATDQVTGVKYNAESASSGHASETNASFAALWTCDAAGNRLTKAVSGTSTPARPAATDLHKQRHQSIHRPHRRQRHPQPQLQRPRRPRQLERLDLKLRQRSQKGETSGSERINIGRRIGKKINGTQEWLLHGGYDLIESHEPVSGATVSYIYEDGID